MKSYILLPLFMFCGYLGLKAQQVETLFNRSHVIGAFGGPIVEYNFANEDVEVSVGGGGALIIDNFFIGGYGISSADYSIFDNNERVNIDLAHGGFWLGYTMQSHKLLHFYGSTKLGWGGVDLEFDDDDFNYGDAVFVVQPEAGVELNVFRFMKIAATAGYRWVNGIDDNLSLAPDRFDGFSALLTFRFGGFGHRNYINRHRDDW